ncbi:replication protein RepA (plasmid) [Nocardia sp. NBC_01503]|uniref:replication protein RepA n=1 Tax=Nocardia sp. NBC_01503 TaxID=2975997 RepID=UPI002E7B60B9|nr:replication protein RepA [Nocardia sp. NBC_01503]WTL36674.1 replication protein RepA [Nocardia sp. NBC_01503]WTL36773.1 replication protein RepA [Nocardia sp. NBC_01503]
MARPKRDELALIQAADLLQQSDDQELAFTTPFLAQACLPYRNPGDIPVWKRRNGGVVLTIRPGYVEDPKTGESRSLGYPSGVIPRQLMFWLITEARRTKSPELILGDGVVEFFRQLKPGGATSGGDTGSLTRLRTQTEKLLHAAISVRSERPGPDGEPAVLIKNLSVAHQVMLWGSEKAGTDRAVVQLSTDFYNEILERAVPLDMRALQLFGDDAWCMDLYIFLTYRFATLNRTITIPLEDLSAQFGAARKLDTKEARYKYRKAFDKKLARVLSVYRDANVESTPAGLVLSPSKTHVRFKGLRTMELGTTNQLTLDASA